jgi:hypothetical protein
VVMASVWTGWDKYRRLGVIAGSVSGEVACLQKLVHLAAGRWIAPVARAGPPRSVS